MSGFCSLHKHTTYLSIGISLFQFSSVFIFTYARVMMSSISNPNNSFRSCWMSERYDSGNKKKAVENKTIKKIYITGRLSSEHSPTDRMTLAEQFYNVSRLPRPQSMRLLFFFLWPFCSTRRNPSKKINAHSDEQSRCDLRSLCIESNGAIKIIVELADHLNWCELYIYVERNWQVTVSPSRPTSSQRIAKFISAGSSFRWIHVEHRKSTTNRWIGSLARIPPVDTVNGEYTLNIKRNNGLINSEEWRQKKELAFARTAAPTEWRPHCSRHSLGKYIVWIVRRMCLNWIRSHTDVFILFLVAFRSFRLIDTRRGIQSTRAAHRQPICRFVFYVNAARVQFELNSRCKYPTNPSRRNVFSRANRRLSLLKIWIVSFYYNVMFPFPLNNKSEREKNTLA